MIALLESRRHLFGRHAGDPRGARACPVCRMALDQDHGEALELARQIREASLAAAGVEGF